jgi:hypothetical protein
VRVSEEYGMLSVHISGEWDIVVYPKPEHTPARFTILNFPVEDIDNKAVYELIERGECASSATTTPRRTRRASTRRWGPVDRVVQGPPAGNVVSVIQQD